MLPGLLVNQVKTWHSFSRYPAVEVSMLEMMAQQTGLPVPELAKDVVFNVAASFLIKMMEPGVNDRMPLDVEAFVKQIQDELGRLGLRLIQNEKREMSTLVGYCQIVI